jgi:TM2 domain-containing membrane protein YozV
MIKKEISKTNSRNDALKKTSAGRFGLAGNGGNPVAYAAMTGQGSTGNVIAALCSFFIPGLGQLLQGRPITGLVHFCLTGILWVFFLGWIMHLLSALEAALFKPKI